MTAVTAARQIRGRVDKIGPPGSPTRAFEKI
jgi:hypothetical protein